MFFFKSSNKTKAAAPATVPAPAPPTPSNPYHGFSDGFAGSQSRRGSDSSNDQHQAPSEGGQYLCACKGCTCGQSVEYPGDMCGDCANNRH
ncbi:hypothetical protein B0T20DRAFT_33263 [Sordaria brevicollis]|uniref:Uncharacterized protein n=1 Tax=Sordaria brevicollis TaxID=83679 RepID=A0AAE0P8P8_SORBR|nr:hypothetical protein B0T20DRAFT_33263 [Sordaria brevicollis]